MSADMPAAPRRGDMRGPVFVFERVDPTGRSLDWLREQGVALALGRAMWEAPMRYGEDEIIAVATGHVAVMGASGARFTAGVIDALPDLRFISKFGIGVDNIDVAAASARGILVSHTPDDHDIVAVCEHTIACILALKKRLLVWTPEFMRAGGWRGNVFSGFLRGNTVGIIGYGRIGRGVAARLAGWGVKILVHSPRRKEFGDDVTPVDLATLLANSDVVTLHATVNAGSRHMINAATLKAMKRDGLLINTSRGGLVDYAALREALADGTIAGAALDVFESEPPDPSDPIFRLPNVIFTPHTAGWTREGVESMGWHGARNLWGMISGSGHVDLVNPQAARAAATR